jgi:hypothetical protein
VSWLVAFIAGAVVCLLVSQWLVANRPGLAQKVGLRISQAAVAPGAPEGPPAVAPDAIPDTASSSTSIEEIERIPHSELRRLLLALKTWKPKHHAGEDAFQRSFMRHLLANGYAEDEIERHKRMTWTAREREPNTDDKRAVPDFVIGGKVLVEIKRNVTGSGESDRSLGQMQRYSIAFRRTGPAVLIVCNEYDENLRIFVERTIRAWKSQGTPVLAYFARHPSVIEGDDEFPKDQWA